MLAHDDVLGAIDLRVDYLGGNSSVEEHGIILQDVNKYELCAEHTLEQTEWWPFVHCMYGLQGCLSYKYNDGRVAMTCDEAESGADDDLGLAGTDVVAGEDCECSLEGVVEYCAAEHTSTTLDELRACKDSEQADVWYKTSDDIAEVVNDGDPLWVKIDGVTYSYSTNETSQGLALWATSVFSVTCQALLQAKGVEALPTSCAKLLYLPASA